MATFFMLAACVTINVYFPAAAIQKAADEIVDEVRGTEVPPKEKTPSDIKNGQSRLYLKFKRFSLGPSNAYAQADLNVSTPTGKTIRKGMCDLFPSLLPYYEKGAIGENNNGFIEIRNASGFPLKETADMRRLVERENRYRTRLYDEVVKTNKLGRKALPQVQKIFANSWRSKSKRGWWIQKDTGEWEKKP